MDGMKNKNTKRPGFRMRNALLWILVSCVVLGLAAGCQPEQPTGSSSSQITTTPPTTAPTTNPTTAPTTGPDPGNDGDDMVKYSDVVARLYDIKWQARKENQAETSYQWSTSDRASVYNEETGLYENWDANNDGGFKMRDENNNSLTIDIQGSGYVSRLWFASVYVKGKIHIIVDGETVVSMDLMEYMVGVNSNAYASDVDFIDSKDKSFFSAHTYKNLSYLSSKGYNSFIPITFSESIQIMFSNVTAESGYDAASFKQIDYTLFDDNRQVESFTGFDNMSAENMAALEKANSSFDFAVPMNGSAIALAAGERKEVYNNQKPGAIHMVKMQLPNVAKEDLPAVLRQLYIQINWDGQKTPAMFMNMGDFFGSPAEIKPYQTLNVGVTNENVFYLQFYMPFEKASISFINNSDKDLSVKAELVVEDITQKEAEQTMRFCASWKKLEDRAVTSDRWPECTTLTLQGSGRLVGQIWHTYQVLEGFWWGEGDERIYVDGEKMPSWAGTGCEDVIGYAWAIPTSWVFSAPFRAHPVGAGSSSAIGDKVNVLMFNAAAPTFDTSLEMTLEKYFSDEYCFVSAISYYYLDSADVEANGKGEYSAAERSACAPLAEVGPEVPAVYRYEGELINGFVEITGGTKYGQWLGAGWSGRGQLCWFDCGDGSDNAELSFPIRVEESGNYNIRIAYTTAIDFATVDVYLDDEKIQENVNLFSYGISRSVHELGLRHIEAGEHTVKFVVVGADARCVPNNSSQMVGSDSYVFGFDYFEIEPENFHRINSSDILGLEMLKSGGYFVSEIHESSACSSTDFLTFYNTEGEVAFEIDFAHSGNYTLEMSFVKANSFGIVQVYLDDVLIGSAVDLYHNGLKTTGNLDFGTMDITKGTHKLSFKTPTKNEKALGYLFAIDHIDIITNSITEDPAQIEQKNQRYEAENLIPFVSCENGGEYWHQNAWDIGNPALSAKGQLVWINNRVGSVMTIPFNVHQTGHYQLKTKFFKAADFAQFDVYVDDVKVITGYDCYNGSMTLGDVVKLGEFDLTEGTHTIKIVITGKNEASTGYVFAMDYIDMDYTTEENNTRIEIEDLHEQIRIENGDLWKKEQNSLYSNFYQEFYWHNSKNDYMEFDFTVEEDADYDFRGVFCLSHDFGIVQFYVDGHKLGAPMDLYQGIEGISTRLFIGNYALKAGQHTLRVVAVDKNLASSAYAIGIDFIDIINVGPWHEEAPDEPDVPDVPDEPQKPEIPENATILRYEAENLIHYLHCVNGGGYWHQNAWDIGNPPLSGQAQLVWIDNQVGSTLTFPFNVHHAGEYFLFTKFCKAGDFATFNLYVDDVLVLENYDCFDGALCLTDEEYLGKYVFTEGTHNIKIEVTGKNELSTGYVFAMDYIEMRYTTQEAYTRVEVESLDGQIGIAGGRLWAQPKDSLYSGGHMELLLENGLNDYMEFRFSVAEDGNYNILGAFCRAADFGIVQFYVDGQKLGDPIDFYNPAEQITARMLLGNVSLKAGEHTFKAVVIGKHEASFGYLIGIDFIDISRAGEYVEPSAPVVHPLDYEMEHFGDVVVIENANRPFYQGMGPDFSGSAQLCWVANQGAVMVIPFQVEHDGEYSLVTQFCKAGDFAIFDLYVDGVKVLDSYDGYCSYLTASGAVDLGKFQFTKGEHTIRIELTGKNDASTGYVFAIDYLKMEFTTQDVFHRIEVEKLDGSVRIQGGRLWAQPKNTLSYSNGHMELLLENGQNDYMEFDFTVDKAGNYDLFGAFCKAADFGIVQIYVDGVALGDPIDFYNEWETVSGKLLLGNLQLEAGQHTMKLLVIGKQDASYGYLVGMDYLELVPKEE